MLRRTRLVEDRDRVEHREGGSRGETNKRALGQDRGRRGGGQLPKKGGHEQVATSDRIDEEGEHAATGFGQQWQRRKGSKRQEEKAEAERPEHIEREHENDLGRDEECGM